MRDFGRHDVTIFAMSYLLVEVCINGKERKFEKNVDFMLVEQNTFKESNGKRAIHTKCSNAFILEIVCFLLPKVVIIFVHVFHPMCEGKKTVI